MKVIAVVQARIDSTRLPGKVLLDINGKKVIEHVVDRVLKASLIDDLIVATSIEKNNLPIIALCASKGIRVFIGSENDVLDRFYQACKLLKPAHIVRITADCPIIDPEVIDKTILSHFETNADYSSNAINQTYPDGLDVEVFKFEALKLAWQNAVLESEREHVTAFIYKNSSKFKINTVDSPVNHGHHRWTLDTPKDLELIKRIVALLAPENQHFGLNEVLSLFEKNPELELLNNEILRNEGYTKSLMNDRKIDFNPE